MEGDEEEEEEKTNFVINIVNFLKQSIIIKNKIFHIFFAGFSK